MTRRGYLIASALAVGLSAAGVWLAASPATEAPGSVLSRRHDGWLAARRYLEARDARVALLDDADSHADGVLALVFPWQRGGATGVPRLRRHLHEGGTLLFAYSGHGSRDEKEVAEAAGMTMVSPPKPPLHPLRWREQMAASSDLAPGEAAGARAPIRVTTPRAMPFPPAGATILFRAASGQPAAFSFPYGGGRVFVLPAGAFSNARLGHPGNADFLESLALALGPDWAFDEMHHGLLPAAPPEQTKAALRAMDAFLLQLAFVYALAVLAVSRRFGPAWDDPPAVTGSTVSFLRGVGALHHRHGHHREAAALLLARSRQLDPRLVLSPQEADVAGGAALLSLARDIGAAQTGAEREK